MLNKTKMVTKKTPTNPNKEKKKQTEENEVKYLLIIFISHYYSQQI